MKVYTLLENTTAREDLKCAHGLSLYIETEECNVLFDAGPDASFSENARKMGVDLENADYCVLSHGHNDHGGGLETFLQLNSKAKILLSSQAFGAYYSYKEGKYSYLGLDEKLRQYEDRFIFVSGVMELGSLLIFGNVKGKRCCSPANGNLFIKIDDDTFVNDGFIHEQDLVITENGKEVLFAGCAHKGIVNILDEYERILGETPAAVFGGFHFNGGGIAYDKVADTVEASCDELVKHPETVFYTGHCTGKEAYEHMKERLGDRLHRLSTGKIFTV